MPLTPNNVISSARALLGKSFIHQSRNTSVGVDCSGLLVVTFGHCGWKPICPALALRDDYAANVDDDAMLRTANIEAVEVEFEGLSLADVILFQWDGYKFPQHIGIVSQFRRGRPYVIHSTQGGVQEHAVAGAWRNLVHSCWRVRGMLPDG